MKEMALKNIIGMMIYFGITGLLGVHFVSMFYGAIVCLGVLLAMDLILG